MPPQLQYFMSQRGLQCKAMCVARPSVTVINNNNKGIGWALVKKLLKNILVNFGQNKPEVHLINYSFIVRGRLQSDQ
jgi:hypothetical protein